MNKNFFKFLKIFSFLLIFITSLPRADAAFFPLIVHVSNELKVIATGNYHSLALNSDGTVWAWGLNQSGQLGDGTNSNRSIPVRVANLSGVIKIFAGLYNSFAIKSDGTIWAWGENVRGALGDGSTINRSIPVQITGISDVIALAPGGFYTLALKSDGTVWGWGANIFGQLTGEDAVTNHLTPVQISGLANVVQLTVGSQNHTLALKSDGTVWAWGNNEFGQLGDGSIITKFKPFQILGLENITSIATGYAHSLALKADGVVWAWGWNQSGQLGDGVGGGYNNISTRPVKVLNLYSVKSISAKFFHSVASRSDGTVWEWGSGRLAPIQVKDKNGEFLFNVIAVEDGVEHSVVFKSDGTVWNWGRNQEGQLGDGSFINKSLAIQVFINGQPLLLLPGIMGSWTRNYDQLLEHSNAPRPQDMVLIEDQRAFIQEPFYGRLNWFIPNTWEALRNSLTATSTGYRYGDNLFDAPYDWRTSNDFNRDAQGSIDIPLTYIRYPGSGWDSDENIARIDTAPEYLMYWIDRAKSASRSDRVDIVAHSMGGLVARAYIQSPLYQNDIRKLAIVGTPNHGAADSYFLWAGGDSKLGQDFGTGLFLSSWFNQMKAHFGQNLTDVGFTHRFFKSVGQLLPVTGFSHEDNNNNRVLDQGEDLNGNNQLDALPGYLLRTDLVPRLGLFSALTFYSRIDTVNQNRFLEVLNTTASAIREKGVDFKIFLGTHLSTAKFARILADSNTTDDRWLDGEPNSPETFSPHEGDERTLVSSGSMPELDASSTQSIIRNDFDHAYLPSHFRTEIVDFLRATISPPGIPLAEEIKATRALSMYVASPVDVLLIDPQGRRVGFDQMTGQEYRDVPMSWYTGNVKNEHIIIPDPILGTYQVILQGNGDGVFTSWATIMCDEKVHESVEQKTVGTVASGAILRFDLLINEGCGVDAFEYGIPATIDIEPRTLHTSSQGNFVSAQISFSSPYIISDIDFSTVMLNNSVSLSPSFISPRSGGADHVVVKFDRGVVAKTLSPGEHTIFISGDLLNGTHFFGTTTLRVLDTKQSGFDSYLILALLGFAGIRIVGLLVKVLV